MNNVYNHIRKLKPKEIEKMALYSFTSDEEKKKMFEKALEELEKIRKPMTYPMFYVAPLSTSPTDIDAKGLYPYQEPEQDEQGTYYGYKILVKHNEFYNRPEYAALYSPRYPVAWVDGELTANEEPQEDTMLGIHFTKRPDHPELSRYIYDPYMYSGKDRTYLVKCALSGTIIETEQGFRAQHARIIGVYINGHWQSYQDYSRRTGSDSSNYPYEEPWGGEITDGSEFNPHP